MLARLPLFLALISGLPSLAVSDEQRLGNMVPMPSDIQWAVLIGSRDEQPCLLTTKALYCLKNSVFDVVVIALEHQYVAGGCASSNCFVLSCHLMAPVCSLRMINTETTTVWANITPHPTTQLSVSSNLVVMADKIPGQLLIYNIATRDKLNLTIEDYNTPSLPLAEALIAANNDIVLLFRSPDVVEYSVMLFYDHAAASWRNATQAFNPPAVFPASPLLSLSHGNLLLMIPYGILLQNFSNHTDANAVRLPFDLWFSSKERAELQYAAIAQDKYLFLQLSSCLDCLHVKIKTAPQAWIDLGMIVLGEGNNVTDIFSDNTQLYAMHTNGVCVVNLQAMYEAFLSTGSPATKALVSTTTKRTVSTTPGTPYVDTSSLTAITANLHTTTTTTNQPVSSSWTPSARTTIPSSATNVSPPLTAEPNTLASTDNAQASSLESVSSTEGSYSSATTKTAAALSKLSQPQAVNSKTSILLIIAGASMFAILCTVMFLVYRYHRRRSRQYTQGLPLLDMEADDKLIPVSAVPAESKPVDTEFGPLLPSTVVHACTMEKLSAAIVSGVDEYIILKHLIACPSLANGVDSHNQTLLTQACLYDRVEVANHLVPLMKNTTVSLLDTSGRAPIHWACLVNSIHCIKAIIRSNDPAAFDLLCLTTATNQSLLHLAVKENNPQLLVMLLEAGRGVLRYKLLEEDSGDESPLALARRLEHSECQALLKVKIQALMRPGETVHEAKRRLQCNWRMHCRRPDRVESGVELVDN
eukprot:m.95794 g.95794  ORF g.95794 m.95794 type:complete len:756 (-) comp15029_c0_seq9:12-2279(-)